VTASSNDDILAVAGASHSQLYHYFTDRDDLVAAVIADRVEQVLSHQESLLADLDSIEGLRLWRDAVVALQEERECRDGCLIGSLAGELSDRDPRSRQAFAAAFDGGTRRSATDLSECASRARSARQPIPTASRSPFSPY
jgi:TetR/AcrR family transcriptional regulator, transcriptional repressor for nem operon